MAEELNGAAVSDTTQATQTTSAAPETASGGAPPASSSKPSRSEQISSGLESAAGDSSTSDTPHLEQQTAQPSFIEQLAEFGEEFQGVTDEADARNRLLAHARAVREERKQLQAWQQQAAPLVRYGQQHVQLARDPEYQAWLAARQAGRQQPAQQAPAQVEQKPQGWWNPPQYDPTEASRYIERVVDDTTGEIVARWKADTPADVRGRAEAYKAHVEKWQDDIATRPHEVLPAIIQQEVAPIIERILAEREQKSTVQSFAEDVISQNGEWLYLRDQNGVPIVDPMSGEPQFTPAGQKVKQYVGWLEQSGMADPRARWFTATRMLQAEVQAQMLAQTSQQTNAAQQNADLAAQKKREVVANGNRPGASHLPNRGGGNPRPQSSKPLDQNKRLSAADRFAAELEKQGHGSATAAQLLGL